MDMFFVLRALQATADNMGDSPRNKRFQSSYCAKVGARAKEMDDPRYKEGLNGVVAFTVIG